MVHLINRHNRTQHGDTLAAMHADRKRVFVDLLKWDVPHDERFERDEFDDDDAVYLVVLHPDSGKHLASTRLLRTDKRHILGGIFPQLCDGPLPCGGDVRELTRFCLAPAIGRSARHQARNRLVRGLIEYALMTSIRAYTGVAEIAWLSQILAAGWAVRPLGLPKDVSGTTLGALEIEIAPDTLRSLVPEWQSGAGAMRMVEYDLPMAA